MARETQTGRAEVARSQNRPLERAQEARTRETRTFSPAVDIFEVDDRYVLVADMPGVSRDSLEINVDRNQLTIEGTRAFGEELVCYRRTFNLPDTVDADHVDAELRDGVLTLNLPLSERAKPKRIEVRGA